MTPTVLVAPSGFKESLGPSEAAEAIALGVRRALPQARVIERPLIDGGEGSTRELVRASGGRLETVQVHGPLGEAVAAELGWLGGTRHAVIEIAAAAGLRLVPPSRRDPTLTSSRGVGELILAALDRGAERLLVGCGDSGVNDGGMGMACALGVRFLDADGRPLPEGGGALERLAAIDASRIDARLRRVRIDAAVNPEVPLLGPRGVARVYGPQKGATPAQVAQLERGLARYAACLHRRPGPDLAALPGAGASGGLGLGLGLAAFAGAALRERFALLLPPLGFEAALAQADLVITAEGRLDAQSLCGKTPGHVARRARAHGVPVIALAGAVAAPAGLEAGGIDAHTSIVPGPCTRDEAYARAADWLAQAAEQALRLVQIGQRLRTGPRRGDRVEAPL